MFKFTVFLCVLSLGLGLEMKTIPPYNEIMSDENHSSKTYSKYLWQGGKDGDMNRIRWGTGNSPHSYNGQLADFYTRRQQSIFWDLIETINNNIEDYNTDLNQEWNDFQNKINEKIQQQEKERDIQYQKKIQELERRDQKRNEELSDYKKKLGKQYRGYMAELLTIEVQLEKKYQKREKERNQELSDFKKGVSNVLHKFHQRLSIQENPVKYEVDFENLEFEVNLK